MNLSLSLPETNSSAEWTLSPKRANASGRLLSAGSLPLEQDLRQLEASLRDSGKQQALNAALDLYNASRQNALSDDFPVVSSVVLKNACSFIDALPRGVPMPEASLDPDGDIALDWFKQKDYRVSVSVGASRLVYAALFGQNRARGIETFYGAEIPDVILQLLFRLFE